MAETGSEFNSIIMPSFMYNSSVVFCGIVPEIRESPTIQLQSFGLKTLFSNILKVLTIQ